MTDHDGIRYHRNSVCIRVLRFSFANERFSNGQGTLGDMDSMVRENARMVLIVPLCADVYYRKNDNFRRANNRSKAGLYLSLNPNLDVASITLNTNP